MKILLLLFIGKMIDSYLKTLRNVMLFKGYKKVSALLDGLSMLMFLFILSEINQIDNNISKIIVALAVVIGNYTGQLRGDKYTKEKVWMYNIIPESKKEAKKLADKIRDRTFQVLTYDTYNSKKRQTLGIKVYAHTKEESSVLREVIPNYVKFHVVELKSFIWK